MLESKQKHTLQIGFAIPLLAVVVVTTAAFKTATYLTGSSLVNTIVISLYIYVSSGGRLLSAVPLDISTHSNRV